jgi:hypothetical protein
MLPVVEKKLWHLTRSIARRIGHRSSISDPEYRAYIGTHFYTTALGLVVHRNNYAVFGLGDGVFAIDGHLISQNDDVVLGQGWVTRQRDRPSLHIYKSGQVTDKRNFCIATDGVARILHPDYLAAFNQFCYDPLTCERNTYGQDTTLRTFRKHLVAGRPFEDDVALVILKKEL